MVIFYPLYMTCFDWKIPMLSTFFCVANSFFLHLDFCLTYCNFSLPDTYICLCIAIKTYVSLLTEEHTSGSWHTGFPIPSPTHHSLWGFHSTPTLRSLLPQALIASQCCTVCCSSSGCFSRNVSLNCPAGRNCPAAEGAKLPCAWEQTCLAVSCWFTVLQAFWALVFVSILQQ